MAVPAALVPSGVILHKLNAKTRSLDNLGEITGGVGRAAWALSGKTLLITRTLNDVTNIWEYDVANRALKQVTFGAGPDLSPMCDPLRNGIYFINGKKSGSLTVYHPRTKQSLDLVTENATQPVLSVDGRKVAYLTLVGNGRQELWISDIDGNNHFRLGASLGFTTLAWSLDNSQFTFGDAATNVTKLYSIKTDGSNLRQIPWSGAFVGEAIWSPDGKTLYFSGTEKDPEKVTTWKTPSDLSRVETVAEGCGGVQDVSLNGRYLLSTTFTVEAEKTGVYQLSVDDGKCSVLIPGLATFVVHFSQDGKSLLYPVASRGEMAIYRQPWKDGKLAGSAQVALKLPFTFRQDYAGNAFDFSKDLSTVIYARPHGQADLYLLSQK